MNDSLLLIFVKYPVPGQVKTRLAATVGDKEAIRIYNLLLFLTREISRKVEADKAVFYGNDFPEADIWTRVDFPRFPQSGDELGSRMMHAFQWGFDKGYRKVVLIGSDCPDISQDILKEAYRSLDTHDFVIGPATDGGYYLMGMKELLPELFLDKEWSTDHVFEDAREEIQKSGKSLYLLPELNDIDTEEDLKGTWLETS